MIEIFGILALTVVVPTWIVFHYITEWKKHRGLSNEDEKMLDEVYDVMDRLDQRLQSLERILDAENADWRKDDPYGDQPFAQRPDKSGDYPREVG